MMWVLNSDHQTAERSPSVQLVCKALKTVGANNTQRGEVAHCTQISHVQELRNYSNTELFSETDQSCSKSFKFLGSLRSKNVRTNSYNVVCGFGS